MGYRFIPPTGLYHAGAREYDPSVGRWLQRDPIGMAGGHPNLYTYCANDPVETADRPACSTSPTLGGSTIAIGASAIDWMTPLGLARRREEGMDFSMALGCGAGLVPIRSLLEENGRSQRRGIRGQVSL